MGLRYVYDKCPVCGEYGFVGEHTCPPAFLVRAEWHEQEDEETVYARNHCHAAEKYVARHYYDLECPPSVTCIVTNLDRTTAWTVRVDVERNPSFYGSEVSPLSLNQERP